MINPRQISEIVHKTLEDLGVREISIEKLIKATFAMESGLSSLYDHSNQYIPRRGLMMMDDPTATEILEEYLKFRPVQRNAVSTTCLMDLEKKTIGERLQALESNIKFMVAITYMFYSSVYDVPPEDDLYDIATYYFKYFKKTGNGNIEKFVETYKSTFINK